MEKIISSLNLNGVALQLTYSKYSEVYCEKHFSKKGNFVTAIKSIDIKNPDNVVSYIIDIVNDEKDALAVVKQFQKLFKKNTGISLLKKGIHLQGYPIWATSIK